MIAKHFRDLWVYKAALETATQLFFLSRQWPAEERYALSDQIRRSSRSVGANIAEAWRKRRYPAHFASKLSDADAECAETQAWLDHALAAGYVDAASYEAMNARCEKISAGLVSMMTETETWCGPAILREESAVYTAGIPPQTSHTSQTAHTPAAAKLELLT
jgi:four helix bundle protein